MRLLNSYVFALAYLLLIGPTKADYAWDYVDVMCDPAKQRVTVKLNTLWNEDPDMAWHGSIRPKKGRLVRQNFRVTSQIDYGECLISWNNPVRVRLSAGEAKEYGMCGGDPEVWLSLWVDKRKWLSRHQIVGRCTTNPMSRIIISPSKMVVCSKQLDPLGDVTKNAKEVCNIFRGAKLAKNRDIREYPGSTAAQPEAGTVVIEHGKSSPLCKAMINKKRTDFSRPEWTVELPSEADTNFSTAGDHGSGERSGNFSKKLFDIDNDGNKEVIYGFHTSGRARDADTYFVSLGTKVDARWPSLSETALWESSPYIFPNVYGYCQNHLC